MDILEFFKQDDWANPDSIQEYKGYTLRYLKKWKQVRIDFLNRRMKAIDCNSKEQGFDLAKTWLKENYGVKTV